MCPEFSHNLANEMVGKDCKGKFLRSGSKIWYEKDMRYSHDEIAMIAGFKTVDDAGQFSYLSYGNQITFSGTSKAFNKSGKNPARSQTVEIARLIAGNSVKVINRMSS